MQRSCNTTPESNHRNQPGQRAESQYPSGPGIDQRSQLSRENGDTVGVTGSIPVSSTNESPCNARRFVVS